MLRRRRLRTSSRLVPAEREQPYEMPDPFTELRATTQDRYGFPIALDPSDQGAFAGPVARAWGLRSIPALVLLDEESRVEAVHDGDAIAARGLRALIEAFVTAARRG